MYQVAILGRRDLSLAPDEIAGFGMAVHADAVLRDRVARRERRCARDAGRGRRRRVPRRGPRRARPSRRERRAARGRRDAGRAAAFEGDWAAFVERQNLSGMAGLLARYGELDSFEGNHLQLVLPESHRMYAEKSYQDKLKAELAPQFGAGFRLSVRVGRDERHAAWRPCAARKRRRSSTAPTAALESDPFVRDLVEGMGAQVVTSSIRPAGDEDSGATENRRGKP